MNMIEESIRETIEIVVKVRVIEEIIDQGMIIEIHLEMIGGIMTETVTSLIGIMTDNEVETLIEEIGMVIGIEGDRIQYLCKMATLKKTKKLVFKTNCRLMQVKSIAKCSKESILQYFRPLLSYQLLYRSLYCLFFSGRFTQVLLYVFILVHEPGYSTPLVSS